MLEIAHGGARAVIAKVGAGLKSFEVDGVPYVETYDGEPPMGSGAVLVPWPNRTAGGTWVLDGAEQQLEIGETARGNAIHGLVRHAEWTVVEHTGSLVSLEVGVEGQGWPVPLRTTITYALDDEGLTVSHGVHNLGSARTPFGVGTHPYPRAGKSSTDTSTLTLAATTVLPLDPERMIPSGPAVPVSGESDFRAARLLKGVELDTPFGGCEPVDGLVRHQLRGPDGGVEVWADPDFKWVQVYTPDNFPGRGRAVAIEPMTCPPDALNSGVDLLWLAPGESWAGRWGLRPLA
ncbi:aldose 1-epimerase family protein [Actinosynnema pretiosum subsp. pretiosum]|uniref:Aldose 1-epimerase n=2 Tax=Actinosynnema TaxID=40566 RepID=C6WI39_ACTMD|nr:aldose 1-epimerase family protein [Actinosynnema mirum]ACU34490.1 Aldose 1-epimerase [Actinosynnema mirum DSM 43827]AXX27860.1 aldose 1-epimerase [Actinosynnema pretiosum subsp. pretiosum]QUF01453.1 aldose 1-epimerase family protein [Actinosynnema pretiosum subsp. pretiosum]